MKLYPTPTQAAFVLSPAEIAALIGPMGEGKTFAGGLRLLAMARGLTAPMRAAIVRDTGPNIEQHTIPSLQRAFGEISRFKTLRAGGWSWRAPRLDCLLFGVDSLQDLSRFQGAEFDAVWLEEPAPIISGGSAGLREEVFTMACAGRTTGRFEGARRVQLTLNPASEEHWVHRVLVEEPLPGTALFHLPPDSNPHLNPAERARMRSVFAGRPDLEARYVRGEWGAVQLGEAVTPEYRPSLHLDRAVLLPRAGVEVLRSWDGWHHPALATLQAAPGDRWVVLDSLRGDGIGMRQFIETQVKPLLASKYREVTTWRDVGDETMRTPDQSNTLVSTAGVIEDTLKTGFQSISNAWAPRREAVRTLLTQPLRDGRPMLTLSASATRLHVALGGGWHYAKGADGRVGDRPVKDLHSHVADALTYAAVAIVGHEPVRVIPTYSALNRAKSYAGAAFP